MKRIIRLILVLGLFPVGTALAEKVLFSDLPPAVQKTIAEQKPGDAQGMAIEKETKDGERIFKVTMKRPGKDQKLWIAARGALIKATGPTEASAAASSEKERAENGLKAALGKSEKLRLGDTPVAVQTTIRAHAGSAEIGEIKTEQKEGRLVYQVEYKQEGRNRSLWIAQDGSLLKMDGRAQSVIEDNAGARKTETGREETERNLAFTDVPKAVQDTITAQKGAARTEEITIHQRSKEGTIYYEVTLKKEGNDLELQIEADGTLLPEN